MQRANLKELAVFAVVAEGRSFRAAASQLGLTPSAVSHAIRQLEDRFGVRLLHRTPRSVSLTDAGLRFFERVRPALDQISSAVEDLAHERGRPAGRLRIYANAMAAMTVIAPIWGRFLSMYPDVQLQVEIGQKAIDLAEGGFDAGLGTQNWLTPDVIAIHSFGPFRTAFVGSPAYFSQRRPPRQPEEMARHNCIRYGYEFGSEVSKWRFERNGEEREVAVTGSLTVSTPDMALRAALDGLGVAYMTESHVDMFLRAGQLDAVLREWSPLHSGFFLYYPATGNVSAALRAFIDLLKTQRR